jgi:unsaturated pyranuronate lyase
VHALRAAYIDVDVKRKGRLMQKTILTALAIALPVSLGACSSSPPTKYELRDQTRQDLSPGITRRYISSDKATMAIYEMRKGARISQHYHDSEQLTYVQAGRLRIVVEGKAFVVGAGEVLAIPPYAKHSIEALDATIEIDYFTPKRYNWTDERDETGPLRSEN